MIKTENLFFSYSGSPPYVLDGINLEIGNGEYISVVGENGSGKSTLIRLILNLIKPVKGTLRTQAGRIGYVPQKKDFFNSDFPITVYEALNSYGKLLGVRNKGAIMEKLELLGMSGYKDKLMGTLSGGQNQKILLARALLGNPDLLVLDEPSTGVDMNSQKEIYGFLNKLNRENGITIVSVEHNLDAAVSNSTLIYHLLEGQGHLCTPRQYAAEYLKTRRKDENNA